MEQQMNKYAPQLNAPEEVFMEIFGKLELIWIWQQLLIATFEPIQDYTIIRALRRTLRKSTLTFGQFFYKTGINGTLLKFLLRSIYDDTDLVDTIIINSQAESLTPIDLSMFSKLRKLVLGHVNLRDYTFNLENITDIELDWTMATEQEIHEFFTNLPNIKRLAFDKFHSVSLLNIPFLRLDTIVALNYIDETIIRALFTKFANQLKHFEMRTTDPVSTNNYLNSLIHSEIVAHKLETLRVQLQHHEASEFRISMPTTPLLKSFVLEIHTGYSIIEQTHEIRNQKNQLISSVETPLIDHEEEIVQQTNENAIIEEEWENWD